MKEKDGKLRSLEDVFLVLSAADIDLKDVKTFVQDHTELSKDNLFELAYEMQEQSNLLMKKATLLKLEAAAKHWKEEV